MGRFQADGTLLPAVATLCGAAFVFWFFFMAGLDWPWAVGASVPGGLAVGLAFTVKRLRETIGVVSRSRDRYRSLVDATPVGIALVDRSYRVVSANLTFSSQMGKDIREIIGADLAPMFASCGRNMGDIGIGEEGDGVTFSLACPAAGKGRLTRWYEVYLCQEKGGGDLLTLYVQDRTDRVEFEHRYQELVEMLPLGVFKTDLSGEIVMLNRAGMKILGMDGFPASLGGLIGEVFWNAILHNIDVYGHADLLVEKEIDGGNRSIQLKAERLSDQDGEWIAGIFEDVTQDVAMEEMIERAKEEARAASHAKGAFLAHMSHELRTPLNAISGIGRLLEGRVVDTYSRDLCLDLQAASEHLTSLIGNVLDMAKVEAGQFELERRPFDLHRILDEVQRILIPQASLKDLTFAIEIHPGTPRYLVGDPLRLKQIFLNLAGNSLKFVDEGGITVDVRPEWRNTDGAWGLVFRVSDTGPGIPADRLASIFEPFRQDAEGKRKGGTGLGLTISREFARLMLGDITCESTLGVGTCFTVGVVLEEASAEDMPADDIRDEEPVYAGSALVVDDVPINRKVLRLLLEEASWEVTEAGSGEEALEMLASGGSFDIVFMDVSMPGMDGIETTRRIRQEGGSDSSVPVLAVTAHAVSGDRERFLAAGMDGYVSKPVSPASFWPEVARVIGRQQGKGASSEELAKGRALRSKAGDVNGIIHSPVDFPALLATCQGMEDLARELLRDFVRESGNWLAEAEAGVKDGDPGRIRRICHLIKGTAGTVSAGRVAATAEELGRMAREGDLDQAPKGLSDLREAIGEIGEWYGSFSGGCQAPPEGQGFPCEGDPSCILERAA